MEDFFTRSREPPPTVPPLPPPTPPPPVHPNEYRVDRFFHFLKPECAKLHEKNWQLFERETYKLFADLRERQQREERDSTTLATSITAPTPSQPSTVASSSPGTGFVEPSNPAIVSIAPSQQPSQEYLDLPPLSVLSGISSLVRFNKQTQEPREEQADVTDDDQDVARLRDVEEPGN